MVDVILKKGKEKAALQRHPWIFSGAIEKVAGSPANGEVVKVLAANKDFLAYGYYNDKSRVAVRLLEWAEEQTIDKEWYQQRIRTAIAARKHVLRKGNTNTCRLVFSEADFLAYGYYNNKSRVAVRLLEWAEEQTIDKEWYQQRIRTAIAARKHVLRKGDTNTCRLVFSEADFLPGLIVDQYADFLSLQILSAGMENIKADIIDILKAELNPTGIFDKSDASARTHESLDVEQGLLWGENPPEFLEVKENGILYHINIEGGQKSGFYCDQRDNRLLLADYAPGKSVLDCFSYSGGFSLNSLKQGATHVTSVDSSALALETLQRNIGLNGFAEDRSTSIQSDVNKQLRVFKEEGKTFDIIVLDPPKYAPSRSALDRAARAYKDLNRLGMGLLKSGGLLATFSCSGAVDLETFKQIIAWAALDAGKEVQIVKQFHQPEDHPVRISFPEGEYLKGLLLRVL